MKLIRMERQASDTVFYFFDDGTFYILKALPPMCDFVMKAWEKRDACGFTLGQTPKGKEAVIYIVPTTDGLSLMVQPKTPLKILHYEKDDSQESMVQITLEDE